VSEFAERDYSGFDRNTTWISSDCCLPYDWPVSTAILASERTLKSASNHVIQQPIRQWCGGERDTSVEPRTRPDAEGIGMEQEKVPSCVKRYREYD
jgi:hypothetical protein